MNDGSVIVAWIDLEMDLNLHSVLTGSLRRISVIRSGGSVGVFNSGFLEARFSIGGDL